MWGINASIDFCDQENGHVTYPKAVISGRPHFPVQGDIFLADPSDGICCVGIRECVAIFFKIFGHGKGALEAWDDIMLTKCSPGMVGVLQIFLYFP